jgi:predicted DNA-binding transcriptional regulator AlpA
MKYDVKQIAEIMGISTSAVYARIAKNETNPRRIKKPIKINNQTFYIYESKINTTFEL